MITIKRKTLINNNVEYLPASRKQFAESVYGIYPPDSDDESEKSYEPPFGTEGFFASIVFLSFGATWCLMVAITTTFIYTLLSYRVT